MDKDMYNGIYGEMVEVLGLGTVKKIYQYYRGQQITFPVRLYSNKYVCDVLRDRYNGKNLKELSRELEYSERWLRHIINESIKEESKAE